MLRLQFFVPRIALTIYLILELTRKLKEEEEYRLELVLVEH